jgi:hypothetical protein
MRTIKELHRDRLVAEAEEADIVGLTKVAEHLTCQVEKTAVRSNDESYTYDGNDFDNDIKNLLWDAVVRTSDFHDSHVDSEKAQKLVEHYAELLISDIRKIAKITNNIGAYESNVPGECRRTNILIIDEE